MTKIHEFDPQIYPFMLWVAINPTLEEITKKLYFFDMDGTIVLPTQRELTGDDNNDARTFKVASKDTGRYGYFINILIPKNFDASLMAHEACHVADGIAEKLGFTERSFNNSEPYAYLLSWIVECLDSVKKNEGQKNRKKKKK